MSFLASLVGQHQAIALLSQAVRQQRVAPAYLFAGPDGVGRALMARGFAEMLFERAIADGSQGDRGARSVSDRIARGNHPDLLWVQPTYRHKGQSLSGAEMAAAGLSPKAPPQIRIEQVREIARFVARPPLASDRALVVVEGAETANEAAANALLKTLEEPGRSMLILLAPSPAALLPTLVSRCARIPFYRLADREMVRVLQQVGRGDLAEEKTLLAIARGSPGRAIVAWERLQAIPPTLRDRAARLLSAAASPMASSRAASLQDLREALELARDIDRELDVETQLWLLEDLAARFWQERRQHWCVREGDAIARPLTCLERTRDRLLAYAQPRLAWEVALLSLAGEKLP